MTDMFNKCALPPNAFSIEHMLSPADACLRAAGAPRMTDQCFRKCVAFYKEPDLSVGEATCVDRCVHKYMTSHTKVQEILNKHAVAAAAQQGR